MKVIYKRENYAVNSDRNKSGKCTNFVKTKSKWIKIVLVGNLGKSLKIEICDLDMCINYLNIHIRFFLFFNVVDTEYLLHTG